MKKVKVNIKIVQRLLEEAKHDLAVYLNTERIRVNLMLVEDDHLAIVASTSGYDATELSIKIGKGQGCSGKAWEAQSPVVANLLETIDPVRDWNIPEEQNVKVNKEIKAILSVPVLERGGYEQVHKEVRVLGVFNVDCLDAVADQIAALNRATIMKYSYILSEILDEESK